MKALIDSEGREEGVCYRLREQCVCYRLTQPEYSLYEVFHRASMLYATV